jgi:acetolactate decarboxylase
MDALMAGRYEGLTTAGNLTQLGDFGLGTFEGLDGEMIVLTGVVYRAGVDGAAAPVPPETRVPFAAVTFFDADEMFDVEKLTLAGLKKALDWKRLSSGPVYAIRVHGYYSSIKVRSVPRQTPPYPPLLDVLKDQAVFSYTNMSGTLVGFWCPPYLNGVNAANYHLHFLDASGTRGGHVLDFEMKRGRIEWDITPTIRVQLPPDGDFPSGQSYK